MTAFEAIVLVVDGMAYMTSCALTLSAITGCRLYGTAQSSIGNVPSAAIHSSCSVWHQIAVTTPSGGNRDPIIRGLCLRD
ncbi:MAG: hypothetical protein O3A51_00375 [Verrucomicrobia bacterium]|nr:hypothetical protein [Verrucomicrobiota bacterium]